MKPVLVLAFMLLFASCAYAQTGMPQFLSCTEAAFNFSFSLGSKWKFSVPKMGPVEIRNMDNDVSGWSLKMKLAKPDTVRNIFRNYTLTHDSINCRNHPKIF